MKEQFIPYRQALKLRELEFDEEVIACYFTKNGDLLYNRAPMTNLDKEFLPAPLWQQAFDWVLGKINSPNYYLKYYSEWEVHLMSFDKHDSEIYLTYFGDKESCLTKLIEILVNKK